MTTTRFTRPSERTQAAPAPERTVEPRRLWVADVVWSDDAGCEHTRRIEAPDRDALEQLLAAVRVKYHQRPGYVETRSFVTIDHRGRRATPEPGARTRRVGAAEIAALRATLRGDAA